MIRFFKQQGYSLGFSMIELIIVIAILGVFSLFAIVAFSDASQQKDVRAFNTLQATLQSVVIQGADRTNSQPKDLSLATVITAMPPHTYLNLTVVGATIKAETVSDNSRSVSFNINGCNSVCMVAATGFADYTLQPIPSQDCAVPPPATPCNYLEGS
jgi:prepilin-type N-terminal cleavage/methylation domain-containing protein